MRVSNVRVLNSTNTSLQAKVFFSGFVQDATVDLSFRTNTSACTPLDNGLKKRVRLKSTNVKNFVESITFPSGRTFDKNSIATINVNLLFPAPGGVGGGTTTTVATTTRLRSPGGSLSTPKAEFIQQLAAKALDNSRVFFKLVPANAFEAVPNGTPFNPNGFSEVRASSGDDIIPLTFKVKDCLGGQPGQTNVVKLQTWMHNTNTSLAPYFVETTFNVRCIQ